MNEGLRPSNFSGKGTGTPQLPQSRGFSEAPLIVVVDVETTGLGHHQRPAREDGVIEIGASWRVDGAVSSWGTLCNPGERFLAAGRADLALRVSGISPEQVLLAQPAEAVAFQFRQILADLFSSQRARIELRAYNRAFDLPFLATPVWGLGRWPWGPCIMERAAQFMGRRFCWPTLSECAAMLGIEVPEKAHRATSDATAALLVDEVVSLRPPKPL